MPELWARAALGIDAVKEQRGLSCGIRVFGVSRSGYMLDCSNLGERRILEDETRYGQAIRPLCCIEREQPLNRLGVAG